MNSTSAHNSIFIHIMIVSVVSKFLILHMMLGDVVNLVLPNCIILSSKGYEYQMSMANRNLVYKGNGQDEKLGKYR